MMKLSMKLMTKLLMYHDDSCGVLLNGDGSCPNCKFHPDMQSLGLREASMNEIKEQAAKYSMKNFMGSRRKVISLETLIDCV